jgi:hypothetical protein
MLHPWLQGEPLLPRRRAPVDEISVARKRRNDPKPARPPCRASAFRRRRGSCLSLWARRVVTVRPGTRTEHGHCVIELVVDRFVIKRLAVRQAQTGEHFERVYAGSCPSSDSSARAGHGWPRVLWQVRQRPDGQLGTGHVRPKATTTKGSRRSVPELCGRPVGGSGHPRYGSARLRRPSRPRSW